MCVFLSNLYYSTRESKNQVVDLFICGVYQESRHFFKNDKNIEYAESEFRNFELVICKYISL